MAPPDMTKTIFSIQPAPPVKNKKAYPVRGMPSKDAAFYLPALALPRSGSKSIISARGYSVPKHP